MDEEKKLENTQAKLDVEAGVKIQRIPFWKLPFHWIGIILGAILVLPVGWPLIPVEKDPDEKEKSVGAKIARLLARLRGEWTGLAAWKRWCMYTALAIFLVTALQLPSQGDLQSFEQCLLKGDFNPPKSSGSLSFIRTWADRNAARELLQALSKDGADPETLKPQAAKALLLVASQPRDMVGLAALARWYAWRGERLAAERVALENVNDNSNSLLPYILVPEIGAAYCEGSVKASEQARAIMESRLRFLKLVKDRGKVARLFANGVDSLQNYRETGLATLPWFNASPKEWEIARKNTEDRYTKQMSREAFWRFLREPFKEGPLAEDVLNGMQNSGASEDEQAAVLADWRGDTELAQKKYDQAVALRPRDKGLEHRRASYVQAWLVADSSAKAKAERLKQFDPLHPNSDPWKTLENFPASREASTTEPNGGHGQARNLEKQIKDGQAVLGENEKASEFIFPTDDDLHQWTHERLEHPQWLRPCPIVLPIEDGHGQRIDMGGFLAFLAMQKAAFAPDVVLSIGHASKLYYEKGLYEPGQAVPVTIWPLLKSEWGAEAVIRVEVKTAGSIQKVSMTWMDSTGERHAQGTLKLHQLQRLPSLVAKQIHRWMSLPLSKGQTAAVQRPELPNETLLHRSFEAEQIYRGSQADAWDWKSIHEEAPDSTLAASRWIAVYQSVYATGFQMLVDWVKTHPKDDYARIQAAVLLQNYSRPHKALEILAPLLDRDMGNRWALDLIQRNLESLDAWSQAQALWVGALGEPSRRSELIGKYGDFLVNYAWQARGTDWGSKVGEWNAQIFDVRLEKAEAELAKELAGKNPDPQVYVTMLTAARGLNRDPVSMDAMLAGAETACPQADEPYSTRMMDLMQDWHGSDAEMFAFADKHKEHPRLIVEAYDKVYFRARTGRENPNGLAPEVVYLRSLPDAWTKVDQAYAALLAANPDGSDLWLEYLMRANWLGHTNAALDRLNTMSKKSALLARMRPRLATQGLFWLLEINDMHHAQEALFQKEIEQVLKTEPKDHFFMNYYAKQMAWYGHWSLARKLFDALGEDRVPLIWDAVSYAEARRKAFGPEGQVER